MSQPEQGPFVLPPRASRLSAQSRQAIIVFMDALLAHYPSEPGEEFTVAQLLPPMPLTVAAAVYSGVGRALEEIGYDAFVKEADGIGVLWARRKAVEEDD